MMFCVCLGQGITSSWRAWFFHSRSSQGVAKRQLSCNSIVSLDTTNCRSWSSIWSLPTH